MGGGGVYGNAMPEPMTLGILLLWLFNYLMKYVSMHIDFNYFIMFVVFFIYLYSRNFSLDYIDYSVIGVEVFSEATATCVSISF